MSTPINRKNTLRRQGDILFKPIKYIPHSAERIEGIIVAHGESGNLHQAMGGLVQLFKKPKLERPLYSFEEQEQVVDDPKQIDYLEVKQDTVLKHEEHNQVLLPAGKYAVVHEREYNPFAKEGQKIRQVID